MDAGMDFRLRIATLRRKKHYGYDACDGSRIKTKSESTTSFARV